jgi:peptidyl-prolyl cis-trans isomerase SurA
MSKYTARAFTLICICLTVFALAVVPPVLAQDQKILVTVNDIPITSFDVTTRLNLWKLLGRDTKGEGMRKKALNSIIDDIAKIQEAKKYRAEATEKDLKPRLERVAKNLKTDEAGLKAKLKQNGITMAAMNQYLSAQLAFNRLLVGKYKEKIEVSPAEIDAKLNEFKAQINGQLAKIKADPRMQPITVYQIMEINFPVDSADLIQSRAAEIGQFASRYKGCKSARSAASGIFNVQVGKMIEADSRKIPPQMKNAFNKAGKDKPIGPFRYAKGLQLWGLCGTRRVEPKLPKAEMPTREQVQTVLINKKYDEVEERYGRQFRKDLLIEYRDPAYAE